MKRILKFLLGLILVAVVGLVALYFSLKQPLPDGAEGAKAEELANTMLDALNYEGYQNLEEISWTFRGENSYVWNKKESTVLAQFGDNEVLLNFKNGKHKVIKGSGETIIADTKANFYNDSFWLVAPFKIRDTGVTRKYVETKDGPGLLVTYHSGGVTPGDSYLWVLDEGNRPKYWRFWTQIVPIPGMKFEWTGWTQRQGVWFAQSHPGIGPLSVDITNLEVK